MQLLGHKLVCACLLAVLAQAPGNLAGDDWSPVTKVEQFLTKDTNEKVNILLAQYIRNEHMYRAYASFNARADVNLPGFEKFFLERASNIKNITDYLVTVLNERGGYVRFQDIEVNRSCTYWTERLKQNGIADYRNAETCLHVLNVTVTNKKNVKPRGKRSTVQEQLPTVLESMEDILSLERDSFQKVLDDVNAIEDPQISRKLEDLLDNQFEIAYKIGSIVSRLRQFPKEDMSLGAYTLDLELQEDPKASKYAYSAQAIYIPEFGWI